MPITRGSVIILFMSLMSLSNASCSSALPLPTSRSATEFWCPARRQTLTITIAGYNSYLASAIVSRLRFVRLACVYYDVLDVTLFLTSYLFIICSLKQLQ